MQNIGKMTLASPWWWFFCVLLSGIISDCRESKDMYVLGRHSGSNGPFFLRGTGAMLKLKALA
jgi:hypothetical protein